MTWDEHFAAWMAWRQTHGNVMPPVRRDGRLDPFGRWCNQQRYLARTGRLPADKRARLEQAGFFDASLSSAAPSDDAPASAPDETTARIVTDLATLLADGQRFGTIYADPPWSYANRGTRGAAQGHYQGMTLEALAALPVGELAAPDAHLHLWITSPLLLEAGQLFDAWGFDYVSSFVWDKDRMGLGNYWRINHEILLLGVRGQARSFRARNLPSVVRLPRRKHSAKPEEIRHMIERASPGPYLELFGRRTAPGWTVYGDQVATDLFDHSTIRPEAPRAALPAPEPSQQTHLDDMPPIRAAGGIL